jgi:predicted DNA binding CopG/RHH family protein
MKAAYRWVDPFAEMSDEEFEAHVDKLFTARPATVAVSVRIAPDLLSRVKRQATRTGVPYQTFMKGIVEAAVSRLEQGTSGSRGSSRAARRRRTTPQRKRRSPVT